MEQKSNKNKVSKEAFDKIVNGVKDITNRENMLNF